MNFNKKTIRRMLTRMCTLTICLILIITQTACTANEKTNGNTGVSKTGFFLDTLCSITIFGIYDSSGELLELSEDELNQKLLLLITDAFTVGTSSAFTYISGTQTIASATTIPSIIPFFHNFII